MRRTCTNRTPDGKRLHEPRPRDETADVGAIGDTCLSAAEHPDAANELKGKPDSDGHEARHLRDDAEHEHGHATVWMHQQVAAHHTRDRPGSAETGNLR